MPIFSITCVLSFGSIKINAEHNLCLVTTVSSCMEKEAEM